MDRINKLKALKPAPADAEADINLINQHSTKTLSPEDVFCFSVILCDNEVDRDGERFTNASLEKLAPMFLGKSGLFDHRWSAEKQIARLYRVKAEELSEKNSLGEQKRVLRGSAYMLRGESTKSIIEAIEGGILKEVSVGCAMKKCTCSICGKGFRYNWQLGKRICEEEHILGTSYDGKLCVGDLTDPADAYEFSFVAVPAQRGAGVTKEFDIEDLEKLSKSEREELLRKIHLSLTEDQEKEMRAKILAENQTYLRKGEKI